MEFYNLIFDTKPKEVHFKAETAYDSDSLICGELIPEEPLKMFIDEGTILNNLVRFQDVNNFCLESHIKAAIDKANFTGIQFYKIDVKNRPELNYYGVQIIGKAGKLIRNIKGFQIGMFFDETTWDGSDFFMPEGTTSMFCSQRVAEELSKLNIKNLEITNTKDVEWYNARVE